MRPQCNCLASPIRRHCLGATLAPFFSSDPTWAFGRTYPCFTAHVCVILPPPPHPPPALPPPAPRPEPMRSALSGIPPMGLAVSEVSLGLARPLFVFVVCAARNVDGALVPRPGEPGDDVRMMSAFSDDPNADVMDSTGGLTHSWVFTVRAAAAMIESFGGSDTSKRCLEAICCGCHTRCVHVSDRPRRHQPVVICSVRFSVRCYFSPSG